MVLSVAEQESVARVLAVLEQEGASLRGSKVGRMWVWSANDLRGRLVRRELSTELRRPLQGAGRGSLPTQRAV